jgi:hypothetical protein
MEETANGKNRANVDRRKFTADQFIDIKLTAELEAALDEFTVAGLSYESFREAAATLRRSGHYAHHGEQSAGTAYDDVRSSLLGATARLMEAQQGLVGACEHIEVYLKRKCGIYALDTIRRSPFTNALTAAIEQWWGHYEPHYIMPADERRERIADVATALSVLRTIAKAEIF